jgi:nitrogen regulatory protein PII
MADGQLPRLAVGWQGSARLNAAPGSVIIPASDPGDSEVAMKLITAIVRPNKVEEVSDALQKLGVAGLTVTEVRGHGKQKGHTAIYRGKEYTVNLLPKMELQVVVDDVIADDVIKAIIQSARTGEIGDGRVFVTTVEQSYRIRTGELAI